MSRKVRISDSSLNSYGTRVLTSGVDLVQFRKNPVLLWMHNRAWRGQQSEVLPLGYVENIQVEGDSITGELVFDEQDEFAKQIASKWDGGILRMVSPNFDIIAVDESPDLAVPGQTRATITKAKLVEVSVVDIGGNDNNIALQYQGKELKLSEGGEFPEIPAIQLHNPKKEEMSYKTIALKLGLNEDAPEDKVLSEVSVLLGYKTANETLRKELDDLKLSGITGKVNAAVTVGLLPADKAADMIALGKMDENQLDTVLSLLHKPVKPTTVINTPANGGSVELSKAQKLGDIPEKDWADLRENNNAEYIRLFKAQFGIDPATV